MENPEWARVRLKAILSDLGTLIASRIPGPEVAAEVERYRDEIDELRAILNAEPPEAQEKLPLQPQPAAVTGVGAVS
jgi:hypothetical protein